MKRFFPAILFVLALLWAASSWRPPKAAPGDFDLPSSARFPCSSAVALNRSIPSRAIRSLSFTANKRLAERTAKTQRNALAVGHAFQCSARRPYPVFVVQNADVLGLFGWEQKDRKYFSYAELSPFLRQIEEQGALSEKLQSVQRSAYQNAVLNLRNGLILYQRLKNSLQPEGARNFARRAGILREGVVGCREAARERETGKSFDKTKLDKTAELIERYRRTAEMGYILAVPARAAQEGDWHSVGESLLQSIAAGEIHPVVRITRSSATPTVPANPPPLIRMSILSLVGSQPKNRLV